MEIIADLHLHSKFSRAVSPNMNLQTMATYARQKGINLLTTGDWTHPVWFKEIHNELEEVNEGIYQLKQRVESEKQTGEKLSLRGASVTSNEAILREIATPRQGEARNDVGRNVGFLLSTEISLIYKQGEKVRRIHNLVFVPNLEIAEKVNQALVKRGANIASDGRPIIGMSCHDLLDMILNIDERCILTPCHIWTPHFGVYGSASGFDSLEEAFGDLAKYVYGIETGISSDPEMNWVIPELQNRSILSFSDAHSAPKMGRELTVFEVAELTYKNIRQAIMRTGTKGVKSPEGTEGLNTSGASGTSNTSRILYTVEFYPEEGKYHFSGHRNCKVSYGPEEIKDKGNICPVCHRKLTEGVQFRVQQIAGTTDLAVGEKKIDAAGLVWLTDPSQKHPPFVKLVPLLEIAAESLHSTVNSQKSQNLYNKLCSELHSELHVLLHASLSDISRVGGDHLAKAVGKVRQGEISIQPGYDGEYGRVKVWLDIDDEDKDSDQLSINF